MFALAFAAALRPRLALLRLAKLNMTVRQNRIHLVVLLQHLVIEVLDRGISLLGFVRLFQLIADCVVGCRIGFVSDLHKSQVRVIVLLSQVFCLLDLRIELLGDFFLRSDEFNCATVAYFWLTDVGSRIFQVFSFNEQIFLVVLAFEGKAPELAIIFHEFDDVTADLFNLPRLDDMILGLIVFLVVNLTKKR